MPAVREVCPMAVGCTLRNAAPILTMQWFAELSA